MKQIWEWEPLTWLSPVARGLFLAVSAGLIVLSLVLFVLGSESSTASLIFLVLPVYVGIAYAAIFVLDRTVRFVVRR